MSWQRRWRLILPHMKSKSDFKRRGRRERPCVSSKRRKIWNSECRCWRRKISQSSNSKDTSWWWRRRKLNFLRCSSKKRKRSTRGNLRRPNGCTLTKTGKMRTKKLSNARCTRLRTVLSRRWTKLTKSPNSWNKMSNLILLFKIKMTLWDWIRASSCKTLNLRCW